jgi:hypothetical protein
MRFRSNRTTARALFVAAMIATLVAPLAAQAPATTSFVVNPNFLTGQKLSLTLAIQLDDARSNPQQKSYRTPVSLRVLRKSTSGTTLEWLAGTGARQGVGSQDPVFDMAEKIFADLKLQVQLDSAGKYLGVRNEDELKGRIQGFLELLVPQAVLKIPDVSARAKASETIRAALAPPVLLSAARKELDLYFGISGLRLEPGKPVRVKSGLLNPFGVTGTLDGEMQIVAQPTDTAANEVRIAFSQNYDPQSSLTFSAGKPANPAQQLSMEDRGEFLLDTRNWQVKEVRHMRTIRQNKEAVRTETTVITVE